MRKKILYVFVTFLILFTGVCVCLFFQKTSVQKKESCPFCDQQVLGYQQFYSDDFVIGLYTHKPVYLGHCLIIPKRHVERFEQLTDDEFLHMARLIKKINHAIENVFNTSSYLLLQKNGKEVAQDVPHVHFHYIPRKRNESSFLSFLVKLFYSSARAPINKREMEEVTRMISDQLN